MLEVRNLTKIYDNATDEIAGGIRDATFTLQPGDFFTLLGPSGCGKTTTLRCIAGLETPDAARIVLDGRVLFDGGTGEAVPMNKRNLGMVFQSYAIWPHMSVFENVAFPLTVGGRERYSRRQIGQAVADALATVSLGGYQERPATRLSGGEQQRVALARAIVRKPALLLLDEPLSNLDAQLREEMRGELRQLQRQIGVATLYVTHDQAEALALSDTVAVLDHGRIIQYGTPEDIYFRPRSAFVARFVGATNIVAGTLRAPGVVGALDGRTIACTADDALSAGAAVALCIRPEAITITASGGSTVPPGHNALPGEIRSVAFLGPIIRYDVAVDGTLLQVTASSNARLDSGAAVTLTFPQDKALAVPAD